MRPLLMYNYRRQAGQCSPATLPLGPCPMGASSSSTGPNDQSAEPALGRSFARQRICLVDSAAKRCVGKGEPFDSAAPCRRYYTALLTATETALASGGSRGLLACAPEGVGAAGLFEEPGYGSHSLFMGKGLLDTRAFKAVMAVCPAAWANKKAVLAQAGFEVIKP